MPFKFNPFTRKFDYYEIGVDQFIELTDTPNSYSGQAGKLNRVNAAENALEFVTPNSVALTKGWELVELKEITTATQFVDFTGLDGNTDIFYMLVWAIRNGATTASNYFLQPNGTAVSTTDLHVYADWNGTTASAVASHATRTNGFILGYFDPNLEDIGWGVLYAKTGMRRKLSINEGCELSTGDPRWARSGWVSIWNETTTNITSLRVWADQANGLGVNTKIALFKLRS
jgi:hypothetical protein